MASYRAYWLTYDEANDADRLEQSLEAGRLFELSKGDLETDILVESRFRDYNENFWRYGLRGEYAWVARPQRIAWVSLEGGLDDFPEFEAASGPYVLGSAGYEQYIESTSLFWDGYVQWHDADEDAQSYIEGGGGVVASHAVTKRFGTGFSLRGALAQFDEADPFLNEKRDDTFFSTRAWLRWKLRDGVDLVPSFEYVQNNSNAEFADYSENIVGVDLLWYSW